MSKSNGPNSRTVGRTHQKSRDPNLFTIALHSVASPDKNREMSVKDPQLSIDTTSPTHAQCTPHWALDKLEMRVLPCRRFKPKQTNQKT